MKIIFLKKLDKTRTFKMEKFKFLEHTEDIKFKAYGRNLNEVFKNSALALFKSIYEGRVKLIKKIKFKVKGKDLEALMYNFLEEFLFLIDSKNFLPSTVKVKMGEDKKTIEAEVSGDNARKYQVEMHIKAITYNEMFVRKEKDKWVSQVVLDI